jgi:hypothetical protein
MSLDGAQFKRSAVAAPEHPDDCAHRPHIGQLADAIYRLLIHSLIVGDLLAASISTMTMRPRWQTAHSRNEDPVSCSCWSR